MNYLNLTDLPILGNHLQTSNLIVRQQIVRDNIAKLRNYKFSSVFKTLNYLQRQEFENIFSNQHSLLKSINIQIKKDTQLGLF